MEEKDLNTKSYVDKNDMNFDEWENYLEDRYNVRSIDLPVYGISATDDRYSIDYKLMNLSSKQNNTPQESKGDSIGFLMAVVVIAAGAFMLYMFCKGFS